MEKVVMYKCDYCGKLFTSIVQCKEHERYDHQCLKCKHHEITGYYSDEIVCKLKRCIYGDL